MFNSVRRLGSLQNHVARKASPAAVRFRQPASGSDQPEPDNDQNAPRKDQDSKNRKMNTTPGGGYGMRADEQGYGAVHKGKNSIPNQEEEKYLHGAPEYDARDEVPEVKKKKKKA